jgi:SSS family solute:Na+ symporter
MGVTSGLQAMMDSLGIVGMKDLTNDIPLIIAFVILAAFTYSSGLRAPAAIAIVKDILIYLTAFAAVIVVPIKLGGFGHIFSPDVVPLSKQLLAAPQGMTTGSYGTYATLAFGSALALLLYPHSMTAILSATSGRTVRRNAALLPTYSFMLGLLALLGILALADGVDKLPEFKAGFDQFKNNFAVPALILHNFDPWFAGVAFAAIGIGALVPAAIMSIAAANLFTRNVYREFFHSGVSDRGEAQVAKWMSLIVKFGALAFIFFLPLQYAIQLQLLGGIWMTQILPAVIIGLYTRWLNPWALLIGWGTGTLVGTGLAAAANFGSAYTLVIAGWSFPGYIAVYALALNLVLAIVLTPVFNVFSSKRLDETRPEDYHPAAEAA